MGKAVSRCRRPAEGRFRRMTVWSFRPCRAFQSPWALLAGFLTEWAAAWAALKPVQAALAKLKLDVAALFGVGPMGRPNQPRA